MRFRFGDCILDGETRELLREGRAVRISPKAFDDAREPRFVRTVPAFGYAFCGEGREVRRAASTGLFCRVIGPDAQAGLAEGDNLLGRGPDSVLWIDDDTVSRHHAVIRVGKEAVVLEDLDSRNGTFRGERRLDAAATLSDGDEIRLGSLKLRYRASESSESTKSARSGRSSTRKPR